MADMSLSERYDYLKAAKSSIYNNVRREGGIERDGAGLKIKGAFGKEKETLSALVAGAKGRGFSAERVGVVWQDTVSYGKGPTLCHGSAVPVPETTALSVASCQSLLPVGLTKCQHLGASCPGSQAHR